MSSQQKRYKRDQPTQDGPVRNSTNGPNAQYHSNPFSDSMDSAVRTAYTVIDDYMRAGQEAASRYCGAHHQFDDHYHPYGHDPYHGDWQQSAPWSGAPSPFGPSSPLMYQMTEAMRTWATLFYSAYRMPSGPGFNPMDAYGYTRGPFNNGDARFSDDAGQQKQPGDTDKAQGSTGKSNQRQGESKLVVKISSDRPTEVIPNLGPGAYGVELIVEPLALDTGEAPPIAGLKVSCTADGQVNLSVTVIPDQPTGRYTGSIKNQQGDIVGGLTVVLHDDN